MKVLIFGNSGSGKSTLAAQLASEHGIPHLDLDAIVWEPGKIAVQRDSKHINADLADFLTRHDRWVIEGCYGDLVEAAAGHCTELMFLNPGLDACLANNRRRPWEPHKYASAEAQDAMLENLQAWVTGYYSRQDDWSYHSHRRIFDTFEGTKTELKPEEDGLSFRLAHAPDLPALVQMLVDDPLGSKRETWSDPLPVSYSQAFEEILHDPNNELVVASEGGKLVGMLQITFIPYLTYQGRRRALIEGVRVASGARSRGIGGELIRWAIERARSRQCVMVQLTTDRAREDALRFYERLGFVASHHGMKLHLETQ